MTLSLLLGVALFGFACSITPGPNNTMLLASGANFGFARTLPHLAGVIFGLIVMVLALGLGLSAVFRAYPAIFAILRWAGAAYLIWLAWKLAHSRGLAGGSASDRPMTFLQAAAFQWVNPKAWMIALTAVTTYASPDHFLANLLLVCLILIPVNGSCVAVWAAFGTAVRRFLDRPRRLRIFNVTMAVLLVLSLYPMLETPALPK